MAVRYAVALDVHAAHRGGVEQHVDKVVVQQVDLIDVQHTAVRARQQTRRERVLTVAQHPLQIQRPDHPVLCGADRQLDKRRIRVDRGKHPGKATHRRRLRGALLAADQHAADLGPHRAEHQCQPQHVVTDDGAERIARRHDCSLPPRSIGTCGIPSSRNSSPSRTKPCLEYMSSR